MSDKFLYTFDHVYHFKVEGAHMPYQVFKRKSDGAVMFEVYGEDCTIHPGYAFDGCSFKKRIFGKWFGTWDGPFKLFIKGTGELLPKDDIWSRDDIDRLPLLYYTSGGHDCLTQFKPKGITRKQADAHFYVDMVKVKWKYREVYYKAVRLWSKISGADKDGK